MRWPGVCFRLLCVLPLAAATPGMAQVQVPLPAPARVAPPPPPPPRPVELYRTAIFEFPVRTVTFPAPYLTFPADHLAALVPDYYQDLRFRIGSDFLFDGNGVALRPEAGGVLRDLLRQIRERYVRFTLRIEGHTDATLDDVASDRLALARASAVRDWIAREGGVPAALISVVAAGQRYPLGSEVWANGRDNPINRQKNRRIEVGALPTP